MGSEFSNSHSRALSCSSAGHVWMTSNQGPWPVLFGGNELPSIAANGAPARWPTKWLLDDSMLAAVLAGGVNHDTYMQSLQHKVTVEAIDIHENGGILMLVTGLGNGLSHGPLAKKTQVLVFVNAAGQLRRWQR